MDDEGTTTMPQVVLDWIGAWNSHDGSRLGALYAEGATYEDVSTGLTARGPEGVAGFAEEFANNLVGGLLWELRAPRAQGTGPRPSGPSPRRTRAWSRTGGRPARPSRCGARRPTN